VISEGVFASFAIRIRPPRQGEVRLVGREAKILLLLLLPLPLLLFLPLPTVATADASTASTATIVAAPAAPASLTALCVQLMLLPAASVHAVVAAGPAATSAHCATLHAGGCVLCAGGSGRACAVCCGCWKLCSICWRPWKVLEAVEVMLYYMLEAVDGVLCMLRWLAWPKGFCPMVAIVARRFPRYPAPVGRIAEEALESPQFIPK